MSIATDWQPSTGYVLGDYTVFTGAVLMVCARAHTSPGSEPALESDASVAGMAAGTVVFGDSSVTADWVEELDASTVDRATLAAQIAALSGSFKSKYVITFNRNGNWAPNGYLKIGDVTVAAGEGHPICADSTILDFCIIRTDTDTTDVELLVNDVIEGTYAITAAPYHAFVVGLSISGGDYVSFRNKSTGTTISDTLINMMVELA